MKKGRIFFRILWRTGLILVVVLAGSAAYLFWPVSSTALASRTNPAANYSDSVQRIADLQAGETNGFNPVCKAQLLTHGQKTERVVILVHGYTTCPAQYSELAPLIFGLGYNVLLIPLPHHGLVNRMNEDQSQLTASEIAAYADQVVDIAQGLGNKVIMAGVSLGGVTTAWAAQNRSDLYRAVVISPAFGFKIVPKNLTIAAMRAYMLLPNSYTWWNPEKKEDPGSRIPYAYPRYASHTLAQTLRLGFNVMACARQEPIKAGSLVVVSNLNDESVNLEMIEAVTSDWQKLAPQKVTTYQFPANLKVKHDLINPDPEIDLQGLVYPKLIDLIQAP
jgi:pimeloyl-ACP methyl ester carboxylesterase